MFADLLLHCYDTLTEVSVTTDFWWTSQIGEVASSWLDQAGSQGAPRRAGLGPVLGVGEDGHLGCSCPLASPWTWDVPADTASLLTPRWGGSLWQVVEGTRWLHVARGTRAWPSSADFGRQAGPASA